MFNRTTRKKMRRMLNQLHILREASMSNRRFRKIRRPSLGKIAMICEGFIDDDWKDYDDDTSDGDGLTFDRPPESDWETVKYKNKQYAIKNDINGLEREIKAILSSGDADYDEIDEIEDEIEELKRMYDRIEGYLK